MNEKWKNNAHLKTEDAFDQDDNIRFMIVANKFQTGFNQPLLHTMFLDKSVKDINAVQTLSRLNRIYPGKDDTLVVDFTDSYDEIINAFKRFQGNVESHKELNPEDLGKIYQELLRRGVFTKADIQESITLYTSTNKSDAAVLAGKLSDLKRLAKERLDKERLREFRTLLGRYISLFRYIRALFAINDKELVDFNVFADLLHSYLDPTATAEELEAELKHVYLTKHLVRKVEINPKNDHTSSPTPGDGRSPTAFSKLSTVKEIIEAINTSFKALSGGDVSVLEDFLQEVVVDAELKADVQSNIRNDKETVFKEVIQPKMEERYRKFILGRAPERYLKLTESELMAFIQRNAFLLLRQGAI